MHSLNDRMDAANTLLAPFAVPHGTGLGRVHAEDPDSTRFPFQRDRDRIIHTQAFRRLKGKTQVFLAGKFDHVRTRLTHTMEVAQISRDLARTLSLNEDLAESIALAHDLGHPPFGHAGEEALDAWMRTQGSSFEHNEQSLRIVIVLEPHTAQYAGLNLNREVLEGIQKHRTPFDHPAGPTIARAPTLEAQVTNIADEIAYTGHDCEDGLQAGLFTEQDVLSVQLAADAAEQARPRGTSLRGSLINLLIADLLVETERCMAEQSIGTLTDVYAAATPLVTFSPAMRASLDELRAFLWQRMYEHPTIQERTRHGQEILLALCERYGNDPSEKILALQAETGSTRAEAVKDYVAGMTDGYALTQAETLGIAGAWEIHEK